MMTRHGVLLGLMLAFAVAGRSAAEVVDPADSANLADMSRENGMPEAVLRDAVANGRIAGIMQGCGGEIWQGFYQAFMRQQRRQGYSDKQIAALGVLFGAAQGYTAKAIVEADCTPELARDIGDEVDRRMREWPQGQ